jgi:hypothetical protein
MERDPQAAMASSGGGGAPSVAERGLLIAEIVKTEKKYITTLEGKERLDSTSAFHLMDAQ